MKVVVLLSVLLGLAASKGCPRCAEVDWSSATFYLGDVMMSQDVPDAEAVEGYGRRTFC